MALTRKMLKGMGLTEEQIDTIIEAHTDTVDGLKDKAGQVEGLEKQVKDLQGQIEAAKGGKDWKAEHDKLKGEFDTYKQQVAEKAADDAKLREVRRLGKEAGLSDAGIEKAAKYTDRKGMELGEDGKAKDAAAIVKSLREEWPEYIVKTARKGVQPATPPGDGMVSRTREEIMSIKDTAERQQAIAENMDLFK
jgi:hypothetical protein